MDEMISSLVILLMWFVGGDGILLDMSYDLASDSLVWPGGRKFEITKTFQGENPEGVWVAVQDFCAPEHGGTHMDAPFHFAKGQWTVDQIPTDRLMGAAVRVDISARALVDPDAQLTVEDLRKWEERHGQIPLGSVVFMYSGWGRHWGNEGAYFGNDHQDTSQFHYPGFHPSAAQWLVDNRAIVGIGVDTPSLDYGATGDWLTHRIVGNANVYGLENVANVEQLPEEGARVIVLPMKIRGGTGSPCRILAEFQELNSKSIKANGGHPRNAAVTSWIILLTTASLLSVLY